MELTNRLTRIGRALGIIQLVVFGGITIYSATLISPPSEETAAATLFVMAGILLIGIYSIFRSVALRREFTCGVLYVVLPMIIALFIGELVLWFIPAFFAGVLFLINRYLKQRGANNPASIAT